MRILVTAGPTREYLDPVRFLSNRSTGTLGYAIAGRAAARGHHVTLISGPVGLAPPPGVEVIGIVSAADLARAALAALPEADAVVMTAAVADYTPRDVSPRKLKKTPGPMTVTFVPTVDVLAEMGRRKRPGQALMGFSLETDRGEAALNEACRKLEQKNCDFIVLNGPANFGDVKVNVTVLTRDGRTFDLPGLSKLELADRLIDLLDKT